MITIDQAKALRHGDILIETETNKRWRVNGKIKLWKRDAQRFELPLKHGLYVYGTLTEYNNHCMTIEGA